MTKKESVAVKAQTGKGFEALSASELEALSTEIKARQEAIKEALQKEQFNSLSAAAKTMSETLGWGKLIRIELIPDDAGQNYEVVPRFTVKGSGKRTSTGTNGGDITIKKIGDTHGGITKFKYNDQEFTGIQDLVKALKQPGTDKSEAERCWEINKKQGINKGVSASDLVIKFHDDVVLVYADGTEQTVKDAV